MLQLPLDKQDTVPDPERLYPLLQLYIAVLSNVVVVNVLDPSLIIGGPPQSTAVNEYKYTLPYMSFLYLAIGVSVFEDGKVKVRLLYIT